MDITFASLLTVAGASTAGALIMTLVEVVKRAFPVVDARVSGATLAFLSATGLFVGTGLAVAPLTPDLGLQIFVSWLNVVAVAVGLKAVTTHVSLLPAKAAPITDVIEGVVEDSDGTDDEPTDEPVDEPVTDVPADEVQP